jgi:hypothetical protein
VPDEQLPLASQILVENGFPIGGHSSIMVEVDKEWETVGMMHTIEDGYIFRKTRIHLYPLSFIDLTLEDTVEATYMYDRSQTILTPKPPNFMLSLIRHLLKRPIGGPGRLRVEIELDNFIGYALFRIPKFDDEDDMSECVEDSKSDIEEFKKKAEEVLIEVKQWDWGCADQKYLDIVEKLIRGSIRTKTLTECQD